MSESSAVMTVEAEVGSADVSGDNLTFGDEIEDLTSLEGSQPIEDDNRDDPVSVNEMPIRAFSKSTLKGIGSHQGTCS